MTTRAARVVDRFSEIVRRNAATCDGQVIKQIGDEFMLAFPTPAAAVRFGVGMHTSAAAESGFPALRVGAHSGAVLYREGDYVGANVNLAARVTSAAGTGQFVVTPAVRGWRGRRRCRVRRARLPGAQRSERSGGAVRGPRRPELRITHACAGPPHRPPDHEPDRPTRDQRGRRRTESRLGGSGWLPRCGGTPRRPVACSP